MRQEVCSRLEIKDAEQRRRDGKSEARVVTGGKPGWLPGTIRGWNSRAGPPHACWMAPASFSVTWLWDGVDG